MAEETNLNILLKKIASEQNYSNPDFKVSPFSTDGANYTSKLYRIKITSDGKDDLQLFAKVAAMGENMREQFDLEFYDDELFLYTDLMRIYRGLEEKYNIPEEHKLAVPKYYGANATRLQEILVLEDLSSQGFELRDCQQPVSWEYAAAAVTELAKFHALSLAFQHTDPTGFSKVSNMLPSGLFTEHKENHVFYKGVVKSALAAIRVENKDKLQRFLDGTSLSKYSIHCGPLRRPLLIHADFRVSNMLYRLRKDSTLELMTVDFQTIQTGCPVVDLLYFIFLSTDGQFRAKHYQELVEYYYSELGAALARLGLDVEKEYSRQDFEFELKEKLPHGLHLSVILLPIIFVGKNDAPTPDQELSMSKMVVPTGDHYTRRLNEVVDDFVAWGILE